MHIVHSADNFSSQSLDEYNEAMLFWQSSSE